MRIEPTDADAPFGLYLHSSSRSCLTRWFLRYARVQNAHLRLVNSAFSHFASLKIPLVIQLQKSGCYNLINRLRRSWVLYRSRTPTLNKKATRLDGLWAVDEDWTHDLFLTKEVLYPWATTATALEEWCKSRKQISFEQIFRPLFIARRVFHAQSDISYTSYISYTPCNCVTV